MGGTVELLCRQVISFIVIQGGCTVEYTLRRLFLMHGRPKLTLDSRIMVTRLDIQLNIYFYFLFLIQRDTS